MASSQRLLAFISSHSPAMCCAEDDVTLEYCCRVAEGSRAQDMDDVNALTDLLNDLLLQHSVPNTTAVSSTGSQSVMSETKLLTGPQVAAWLQQLHSPASAAEPSPGVPCSQPTARSVAVVAKTQRDMNQPGFADTVSGSSSMGNVTDGSPAVGKGMHASEPSQLSTAMAASNSTSAWAAVQPHKWNLSAVEFVPGDRSAGGSSQPTSTTAPLSQDIGSDGPSSTTWQQHTHPADQAMGLPQPITPGYGSMPGSAWDGGMWAPHDDYAGCGMWPGSEAHQDSADLDPEGLLCGMFPGYDSAVLQQLLAAHGSDLNAAVEELLMLEGSQRPQQPTRPGVAAGQVHASEVSAENDSPSIQHSPAPHVFSVGDDVDVQSAATAKAAELALSDQTAFPSLGSMAARLPSPLPTSPPVASSWANVIGSRAPPASPPNLVGTTRQPSGSASARQRSGLAVGGTRWAGRAQDVPHVATGQALSAQYQQCRQEAQGWARARNMCFQQATQAYLSGNKALARELSARGKQFAERMWAAHGEAVHDLMATRGAIRTSTVPGGPLLLDLHGLHISEALAVLHDHLLGGSSAPLGGRRDEPHQVMHVLVGVGKHSKTAGPAPAARLLTAVQNELNRLGMRWQQLQPGLLAVLLNKG